MRTSLARQSQDRLSWAAGFQSGPTHPLLSTAIHSRALFFPRVLSTIFPPGNWQSRLFHAVHSPYYCYYTLFTTAAVHFLAAQGGTHASHL